MKGLILSAGLGTRLGKLTERFPKVMVSVGGKPCLQHNIELLRDAGVKDIAINTHYFPDTIKEYFGDGGDFGVKLVYSYEESLLGTAGALNNFRDFLDGSFFVVQGDTIYDADIKKMMEFHKMHDGIATLSLNDGCQKGRGVAVMNGNKIIDYVEKPEVDIDNGVPSSGIYLFNKEVVSQVGEGVSDFARDIIPRLLKFGVFGFKIGEVIDIGTLDGLEKARAYLRKGNEDLQKIKELSTN